MCLAATVAVGLVILTPADGQAEEEKGSVTPEFVVLYHDAKSAPQGPFKYTLYDTRKGQYDQQKNT
jgi:hypothetical protein